MTQDSIATQNVGNTVGSQTHAQQIYRTFRYNTVQNCNLF